MTKNLRLLMAVIFAVMLSLSSYGQKPGSQPQVNLDVAIDDLASQGLYGFGSDGGGIYVHGSQGVTASFGTTGILHFKTGTTGTTGARTARAYYSTPVAPSGTLLTGSSDAPTTFMTFVNGLYLQTMGVGTTRCEGLLASFAASSSYTRNVGYRAGRGTLTNTAYMLVTHPDVNTWIMDSNSSSACSTTDNNIANIYDSKTKGSGSDIVYGRYNMPLRLILTRR